MESPVSVIYCEDEIPGEMSGQEGAAGAAVLGLPGAETDCSRYLTYCPSYLPTTHFPPIFPPQWRTPHLLSGIFPLNKSSD